MGLDNLNSLVRPVLSNSSVRTFSDGVTSQSRSSNTDSTRTQPELNALGPLLNSAWLGVSCRYTENGLGKRMAIRPNGLRGPAP